MYVPNMGAVTLAEAVSAATAAKQNQNPHHVSAAGVSAAAVGIYASASASAAKAISAAAAAKQDQNPNPASSAGISAASAAPATVSCTTTAGVAGATTGIAAASAAACC